MIRRRLYLQIYVTIIASLALAAVLSAIAFALLFDADRPGAGVIGLAQRVAAMALPAADAPAAEQEAVLRRVGADISVDLALFDAERRLIAASGTPLAAPESRRSGWSRSRGGPRAELRLPDGRWIVARLPVPLAGHRWALPLLLVCVALGVALASYPLVRRLTGRVERLQASVERMGEGDLAARARVEGRDEIAGLASSFNEAAGRIETLVDAHRALLANTSHELRTPLSRVRLGVEMFRRTGEERRLASVETDIRELDRLISEILTLSRLDAASIDMEPDIDLLGLAAEECARMETDAGPGVSIDVSGQPASVTGHRELLRQLVRNLVSNALRHGAPPVEVSVSPAGETVVLTVRDGGRGIDLGERERVFERFHRGAGRQNVEGYGLGLALVRQIANAHDGEAKIAEGPASAVRVVLPRSGSAGSG